MTALDSDSGCGAVLDSASQHSIYSMTQYEHYNTL